MLAFLGLFLIIGRRAVAVFVPFLLILALIAMVLFLFPLLIVLVIVFYLWNIRVVQVKSIVLGKPVDHAIIVLIVVPAITESINQYRGCPHDDQWIHNDYLFLLLTGREWPRGLWAVYFFGLTGRHGLRLLQHHYRSAGRRRRPCDDSLAARTTGSQQNNGRKENGWAEDVFHRWILMGLPAKLYGGLRCCKRSGI